MKRAYIILLLCNLTNLYSFASDKTFKALVDTVICVAGPEGNPHFVSNWGSPICTAYKNFIQAKLQQPEVKQQLSKIILSHAARHTTHEHDSSHFSKNSDDSYLEDFFSSLNLSSDVVPISEPAILEQLIVIVGF